MSYWKSDSRYSLRSKITLLTCLVALGTALLVGSLNYQRTMQNTLDAAIEELAGRTRLMALRFRSGYDEMRNDAFVVSQTPPIEGIVRAAENGGIDPLDGSTGSLWRVRLETIFASIMAVRPHYTQMRYIGFADNGKELVRVNRRPEGLQRVAVENLQEKGERPYMQAAQHIDFDGVYYSDINYNHDNGEVEPIPTIRTLVPVFIGQQFFGVIVINANYELLLRYIFREVNSTKNIFVVTHNGDYLEHKTDGTLGRFEFHENYSAPPPVFMNDVILLGRLEGHLIEHGTVDYFVRLIPDKKNPHAFLDVVIRVPEDNLIAPARAVRNETLFLSGVLVILSLLAAAYLSRRFTKPLNDMTRSVAEVGADIEELYLPTELRDEIGQLARAFSDMINRLTLSEATRQAYVDASGDGYWDWHIEEDYEYMSPRFWEMLGYSPEEKSHHPTAWKGLIFEEDLPLVLGNYQKHVETGGEHPYSQEVRYHHKDGSTVTVLCKGTVVEWGEKGKPLRMIGTHTDLTEIKKAQAEVQESQERARAVLECANEGIIIIDERGIIEDYNPAYEHMFGYTENEVRGKNVKVLMPEPHHSKHDGYLKDYWDTGKKKFIGISREVEGRRKDGRTFPLELSVSEMQMGGRRLFTGIARDITARKEAEAERERLIEELERSNNELDEFAYVASHDLKAPLRVIDNASRWLEEDLAQYLDEDSLENMQLLRSRVSRMERLLDDLLEYSRIGRKMDDQYREVISGQTLMEDILLLLAPPDGFVVKIDDAFDQIKLNRMPVQQILLNLINNAIKHHDKKAGIVEVGVEDMGEVLAFSVKDDGPGIDPQFHDQVFKMFQTLQSRDRVEGSGMGLAMVRKHIEHFGGTLTLNSALGEGATFRFTWPKQQPAV